MHFEASVKRKKAGGDCYFYNIVFHHFPKLTAFEKSWMLSTMTGNRAEIVCHIAEDPRILEFKVMIF